MTEAEKILEKLPSVKIGLDDHYGKQTVLNERDQALSMSGVGSSVFAVIDKMNAITLGCFDSKQKAEKFINGSINLIVSELKVG